MKLTLGIAQRAKVVQFQALKNLPGSINGCLKNSS
jgi:hypothetical protein